LPSATTSTTGYDPSSSSSQATRVLRLRRDMPASQRPQRPGLLFLNGAVSRKAESPASHKPPSSHNLIHKVPLSTKSSTTPAR
jgi:hypothetical protein